MTRSDVDANLSRWTVHALCFNPLFRNLDGMENASSSLNGVKYGTTSRWAHVAIRTPRSEVPILRQ